jgi:hypothetical protein
MMRTSFAFAGILVLAVSLFVFVVPASAHEIELGRPFPSLLLPAIDPPSPLSVADFRGQKLVLHIWASW